MARHLGPETDWQKVRELLNAIEVTHFEALSSSWRDCVTYHKQGTRHFQLGVRDRDVVSDFVYIDTWLPVKVAVDVVASRAAATCTVCDDIHVLRFISETKKRGSA